MGTTSFRGKSVGLLTAVAMLASGLTVVTSMVGAPLAHAAGNVAMFRLLYPGTGEHFYTSGLNEGTVNVSENGWVSEGIGWYAPPSGTGSLVYRLAAKPGTGSAGHLYTTSAAERSAALATGQWTDEGIGWYSSGTVPVYREFNPVTGQHNFTADANENTVLTTQQGWKAEGIAWYGMAGAVQSDQTVNDTIYSMSYYISAFNEAWATNIGCSLGTVAKQAGGARRFVVILNFGYQYQSGSTWMMATYGKGVMTLAQAGTMVYDYGQSFWTCAGQGSNSYVYVALGTQTSAGAVNAAAGAALAAQAALVTNQFANTQGSTRKAYAAGANDFETWAPNTPMDNAANSKAWLAGYSGYVGHPVFFNYGSADGCKGGTVTNPADVTCHPGLPAADIVTLSWSGPAYPLPEIYNPSGVQAEQWRNLSILAKQNLGSYFTFQGALAEQAACDQNGGCSGMDNSPSTAWNQLSSAVAPSYGTVYTPRTNIKKQV